MRICRVTRPNCSIAPLSTCRHWSRLCVTLSNVAIRITRSARKHRIGAAHILEAMSAAGVPELMEGDKLLYIGADSRGVELEIVAVPDDKRPGGVAVIHAMPTQYRDRRSDE